MKIWFCFFKKNIPLKKNTDELNISMHNGSIFRKKQENNKTESCDFLHLFCCKPIQIDLLDC